jgi:hypothetical protein
MSPPAYAKKTLTWWCVFGRVRVAERVWRTQQKNYVRLLPEAIGVTPRGRSKRLERVLTDFGSEHSFQHAAARVQEHYGLAIHASAVREATLHHAGRAEQIPEKEYQQPFRVRGGSIEVKGRCESERSTETRRPNPRRPKEKWHKRASTSRERARRAQRKANPLTGPDGHPLPIRWGGMR